jgi:hypothetical protein
MPKPKPRKETGKLPPAFERFAKTAKAVFGVPRTEAEAEDEKWRRLSSAERRAARKKSGAA